MTASTMARAASSVMTPVEKWYIAAKTTQKVQDDNRQQPSIARCPQSFESQIFRGHPELRTGWRHIRTGATSIAVMISSNCSKNHRMLSSMSRKCDCWDNAVAESYFGSLKIEQVFGVRYLSPSAARRDNVDYIEMFSNSRRRHSSLGYMSPMEFEKQQLWEKAA